MGSFAPEKLAVEFRRGVTETAPVILRRYTLTHSDTTEDLFLTIGQRYAFDKVNQLRDEVLGEWRLIKDELQYSVYLHVDERFGKGTTNIRDYIFRQELPLALKAIRYGDRKFFTVHEELNNVPIIVHFLYANPNYNKAEDWGIFADYNITGLRKRSQLQFQELEEE